MEKHIESILPKLSAATFAMRVVQSFLSLDSLKLIYYSCKDLLLQRNKNGNKFKSKFQIQRCSEMMFVAPVTTAELERVIASLNKNASAGYDEIPVVVIKRCLGYIIKPLVHIFNVSFQSGIFPDQMKRAKIKPLFKKGDKQNMQNCRPISVLSVFL